jgi:hypothetical protein
MLSQHMAPLTSVSRRRILLVACLLGGWWVPAAMSAQAATAPEGASVAVRSVKFTTVRPVGSSDGWLEAAVEVVVAANPAAGPAGRFADRVAVTLNLSLGTHEAAFFRSTAEAVSLETGRATFRFYLPPEILRREQMNTDPYAYAVELSTRGRPAPMSGEAVASVVRSPEALRSFKDRVARSAPLNDGVLVPQYLSPFAATYAADTPSFVRRDR